MPRPFVSTLVVALLAVAGPACRARDEAPPEALQTVGLKLEAPGVPRALDIALSLPEKADPQPVVEALSGALHRAIKTCAVGDAPLRFDADRIVALRLRGNAVEQALTEPAQGTACLVEALEKHELSRRFEPALDVHVMLRKLGS